MRDLIIQGDPTIKTLTLLEPAGPIPAGTVVKAKMEYFYPALDNDPTALGKATLLTDTTAELYGLDDDEATVNNALAIAAETLVDTLPANYYSAAIIRAVDSDGKPVEGIRFTGLEDFASPAVATNRLGEILIYFTGANPIIIEPIIDVIGGFLPPPPQTITPVQNQIVTYTFVLEPEQVGTVYVFEQSTQVTLSDRVAAVDLFLVGGGGAGGGVRTTGNYQAAGGGGGGGYVLSALGISDLPRTNDIIVGAGGAPVLNNNGAAGGSSSALGYVAQGGAGGGLGGSGSSGASGGNGGNGGSGGGGGGGRDGGGQAGGGAGGSNGSNGQNGQQSSTGDAGGVGGVGAGVPTNNPWSDEPGKYYSGGGNGNGGAAGTNGTGNGGAAGTSGGSGIVMIRIAAVH